MKIAIITWWRYNYGSILQAFALQKKLNEIKDIDYEILCQYGKKTASISNLKDKLDKIGIKKTIKRIIWKFGLKRLRKRNSSMQCFVDNYLKVSNIQYNDKNIMEANKVYDGFICGSDQIWNPRLTSLQSIYWLGFANNDKLKIAYAPSLGVSELLEKEKEQIKRNLESFKAISCREQIGTDLINNAIGNDKCKCVLDPTLLIRKNVWDEISNNESMYDEKYIFVYMLRGTKKQRKVIEKFAKYKNLKIVTMPFLDNERIELYDFRFGDIKLWDASPIEFITVIRNAEYVFTDSFHCMLFSCIYHRDFYTFPKIGKAQVNRMTAFQKMINAEKHMISEEVDIEKIEDVQKIDWKSVDTILEQSRKESEDYLIKALKN